jgi:excisionase family DNA binding protein
MIGLAMRNIALPPTGAEKKDGEAAGPGRGEEVFDYRGLAAYLKIPEGTLRHWVAEGRIPYTKLGMHVRFSRNVIDTWFKEHHRDCRAAGKKAGGKAPEGRTLFEDGQTV